MPALRFDRSISQAASTINVDVQPGGANLTVELLARRVPTATAQATLASTRAVGETVDGYILYLDSSATLSGQIRAGSVTISVADAVTLTPDNSWHHYALVRSSGTLTLYYDGVQHGQTTGGTTNSMGSPPTHALNVGIDSTGANRASVDVAEIRVWSVARSQAQIQALMNANAVGNETGLSVLWHAQDGSGTSLVDIVHERTLTLTSVGWEEDDGPPTGGIPPSDYSPATRADIAAMSGTISTNLDDKVSNVLIDTGNLLTSVGTGLHTLTQGVRDEIDGYRTGAGNWVGYGWKAFIDHNQAIFDATAEQLANVSSWTGIRWVDVVARWYKWLAGLGGGTALPGTGWAMDAETDFVTQLAWAQAADLYVFSFTVPPSNAQSNDVAGVTWLGHMLWWAELVGTLAGERHFLDFPAGQIYVPQRRLQGIVLQTNGYSEGHVQAWSYTAPEG